MNKIEKLIKEFCPDGVEWKKLGEVANCFSGGTPKTGNSNFYDGEIPWLRSGEINFNVITKSENSDCRYFSLFSLFKIGINTNRIIEIGINAQNLKLL